jgi:predicted AlkP superfamily pyrophosphatase or phosphodiesterase
MNRTVVLDVVGLSPDLLGTYTPSLGRFQEQGSIASVKEVLPALTCSAQSTYVTGTLPSEHGVVGNGWYFRDTCEIGFWRRPDSLVGGPKIWEVAKAIDPDFTCANLFWRYNTYASAEYTVTERPMYPPDGRKIPDIYTKPAHLRPALQEAFGRFPLFRFWGPLAGIEGSRWIAEAAKWIEERHQPTLSLVYLPHLDYCLQRLGHDAGSIARNLREIDDLTGELIDFYQSRGVQVIILSEYGIDSVSRPVHLNRVLREHGLIAIREELGGELLEAGASTAFAVTDHQVAHVYVNDPARVSEVRSLLEGVPGVAEVLGQQEKREHGLDHPRAGELFAIAEPDAWFTYYYWLEDERSPDFARTVDIHRKPGYDPVELFIDPGLRFPKLKAGATLLKKRLGFRYLMNVIGIDAGLVRGSHGRPSASAGRGPLVMTQRPELLERERIDAPEVFGLILEHLGVAFAEGITRGATSARAG